MQRLSFVLFISVLAWGASSLGYFQLAPLLDADIGYNDAPVFYAGYYGLWALGVAYIFRKSFARFTQFDTPVEHIAGFAFVLVVFAAYAMFVIPRLPEMEWPKPDETPVEFFWATSWYFLPKSIEILFQQILIAALVLALHQMKISLPRIMIVLALMFGGFHLTLALNGHNPVYVARYTVAATVFGAAAPYILLRYRSGFLITYGIHWAFYAVDIALIHLYFSNIS